MFVFGYGSLSAERVAAQVATLAGHIRTWDVAMDNSELIPGYKAYVDPVTRARPAVSVTFLNLTVQTGVACVGFLLPVDAADLERLDARERNYERVEVTSHIRTAAPRPEGPVFAYLGTRAARQRYASAVSAGTAVIARDYLDTVEIRFQAAGLGSQYRISTRPPECPVRDLQRINLPVAGGGPAPEPAAASAPRTGRPDRRSPRR